MKIALLCSTCRHRIIIMNTAEGTIRSVRCDTVGRPHKAKKYGNCNWYTRDRIPEQEVLE